MSDNQSIAKNLIGARPQDLRPQHAVAQSQHQADVDHITVLAHDLRNYLTPAYMHLSSLHVRAQREQRDLDIEAAARGRQALDSALRLITSLVDGMRAERGLFDIAAQPLELTMVARQSAEVFDTANTPIIFQSSEEVIISADPERLRQVLHNLLANAVTHSPRGVPVTVDVRIQQREGGSWCVLTIHNGGAAIPAHLLPHIFQRFTTGPKSRGMGLGLYLARGIVEAHGGTLTAHSHDDVGTCFVLALPLPNHPKHD